MSSLAEKLSEIVGDAFEVQGLPRELGIVRVSDRRDLAQFQCNGAMAAARYKDANNASGVASQAGKNPREMAQAIVDYLTGHSEALALKNLDPSRQAFQDDIWAKIEIAGPGFINLDVTDNFIAGHLAGLDDRFGAAEVSKDTVVLDYGGPNIAKPMHVGHLRSSIIGDALRRMCVFAGYNALGDVHMGDWGLPMGQIISELEVRGTLGDPLTMEQLEEIYPAASNACKEDEARMEKARAATVKLQDGNPEYTKVWQQFIDVSIAGMKKNFEDLDVRFDLWKGEACVHNLIAPMVDKLKAQGIATESDGALVVSVAREDDKKEMPPLILYKRDGAVMYGTTDMATLVDRVALYDDLTKIVYIVDQRQSLHFEQVFRAARMGGIVPEGVELTHAGFGTMNGTDGKPFKTRAGGVMKLEDLISMGVEKAQARLEEAELGKDYDDAERADIAKNVAIAAIKFADLQNNRVADYVFDLDRMTSFEGKTGPYLLYQAVRIQSLLRKAEEQGIDWSGASITVEGVDRGLALLLSEFPDHFAAALDNFAPHVLCDYVFKLAQAFSSFYGSCHILSEEDESLRNSRLALCALTHKQIILILDLLGISVPARM